MEMTPEYTPARLLVSVKDTATGLFFGPMRNSAPSSWGGGVGAGEDQWPRSAETCGGKQVPPGTQTPTHHTLTIIALTTHLGWLSPLTSSLTHRR
jgi:hypothetical protein